MRVPAQTKSMIPETVRGKLDQRGFSLDEVRDTLTYFENWDLVGEMSTDGVLVRMELPLSRNRFERAKQLFEDWYVEDSSIKFGNKINYKDGSGGLLLKADYDSDERTALVSSPYRFEIDKFLGCVPPITDAEKIESYMIEKAPATVEDLIDEFNQRSVMNTLEDLDNRGKAYTVKSGGKTYALHTAVFPEPYSKEGMKVLEDRLRHVHTKRKVSDDFALRAAYTQELSEKSQMIQQKEAS